MEMIEPSTARSSSQYKDLNEYSPHQSLPQTFKYCKKDETLMQDKCKSDLRSIARGSQATVSEDRKSTAQVDYSKSSAHHFRIVNRTCLRSLRRVASPPTLHKTCLNNTKYVKICVEGIEELNIEEFLCLSTQVNTNSVKSPLLTTKDHSEQVKEHPISSCNLIKPFGCKSLYSIMSPSAYTTIILRREHETLCPHCVNMNEGSILRIIDKCQKEESSATSLSIVSTTMLPMLYLAAEVAQWIKRNNNMGDPSDDNLAPISSRSKYEYFDQSRTVTRRSYLIALSSSVVPRANKVFNSYSNDTSLSVKIPRPSESFMLPSAVP